MKITQKIVIPFLRQSGMLVLAKNFSMCMEEMCVPKCEVKLY